MLYYVPNPYLISTLLYLLLSGPNSIWCWQLPPFPHHPSLYHDRNRTRDKWAYQKQLMITPSPVLYWTYITNWILPPWRSRRIDNMGEFVPRPRNCFCYGSPHRGDVVLWRVSVVASVQGRPTLIGVHPPWQPKFLPGVTPYGRICAPDSEIFARGPPPRGNVVRWWVAVVDRGLPLRGMSCGDGSLWLPLCRGSQTWSVYISPGNPEFSRGSPTGRNACPGHTPKFSRGLP